MTKKYKYTRTFTYEGKRYYVRANTLEELGAKIADKKRALADGLVSSGGTATVRLWTEKCIDTYKTNVTPDRLSNFRYVVNKHILSDIGDMKLSQVKPMHCQAILNKQQGMSQTQVNEVLHGLRFIFSHAKQNGLITIDPTTDLIKPTYKKKESRRALTPDERHHIIKVGFTKRKYLFFMLMLFCGCRPTEASICKGSDIVEHNGYNVLHIRGTKTAFSDRFVPIPDKLYDTLKNVPKNQFLAVYENGNPITKYNRTRLWRSFTRQVNLSMGCKTYRNALVPPYPLADDLVPYCLRHEYCTDLARKGIDIRIAQRLMGHATIRMTANIYTNLDVSDTLVVAPLLGATSGATAK